MAEWIAQSVGRGGRNARADVRIVQRLLTLSGKVSPLVPSGVCDPRTIDAILSYQGRFMTKADGRVDPGGRTIRQLNEDADAAPAGDVAPRVLPTGEWDGDPRQWPEDKKLASLEPEFGKTVGEILADLRARSFLPKIVYAWRSIEIQRELLRKGLSKVAFSFHNAQRPDGTPNAYAVDVIDSRWAWNAAAQANGFWDELGAAAHRHDVFWGATGRAFVTGRTCRSCLTPTSRG